MQCQLNTTWITEGDLFCHKSQVVRLKITGIKKIKIVPFDNKAIAVTKLHCKKYGITVTEI